MKSPLPLRIQWANDDEAPYRQNIPITVAPHVEAALTAMPRPSSNERDNRLCACCDCWCSPQQLKSIQSIAPADSTVSPVDLCEDCLEQFESDTCEELDSDTVTHDKFHELRDWIREQQGDDAFGLLLEACKFAAQNIRDGYPNEASAVLEKLEAAVAKAEGRSTQ